MPVGVLELVGEVIGHHLGLKTINRTILIVEVTDRLLSNIGNLGSFVVSQKLVIQVDNLLLRVVASACRMRLVCTREHMLY